MVHIEVLMKVLFYKLLRKRMVPIELYREAIIDRFINAGPPDTGDIFKYIKQEFNADRVYSWHEQKNYLKFNSEKDYMMFLLKI